MVERNVIENS